VEGGAPTAPWPRGLSSTTTWADGEIERALGEERGAARRDGDGAKRWPSERSPRRQQNRSPARTERESCDIAAHRHRRVGRRADAPGHRVRQPAVLEQDSAPPISRPWERRTAPAVGRRRHLQLLERLVGDAAEDRGRGVAAVVHACARRVGDGDEDRELGFSAGRKPANDAL
jgi:hypothetical protein